MPCDIWAPRRSFLRGQLKCAHSQPGLLANVLWPKPVKRSSQESLWKGPYKGDTIERSPAHQSARFLCTLMYKPLSELMRRCQITDFIDRFFSPVNNESRIGTDEKFPSVWFSVPYVHSPITRREFRNNERVTLMSSGDVNKLWSHKY